MSPPPSERHHHYGCFLFLCSIGFLAVVASFGYTYFTCYDAEKNLLRQREDLLVECDHLCDTVPKFSILATKYDMALFNTVNRVKRARKNFYLHRSMADKAVAYYTLENALAVVATTLKDNRLAVKDSRWNDVTKDLRNITNRVNVAQASYSAAVQAYNATLTGEMRKIWLKVLDFKPAEEFEKPIEKSR
jgi:hypothetical protein